MIFFVQDQNFSKIHKTDKKFFWPKQKNTCLIILNDKPNCQVSGILMNPRPIFFHCSEVDSIPTQSFTFTVFFYLGKCEKHQHIF
jgi:hypothetical protein